MVPDVTPPENVVPGGTIPPTVQVSGEEIVPLMPNVMLKGTPTVAGAGLGCGVAPEDATSSVAPASECITPSEAIAATADFRTLPIGDASTNLSAVAAI